MVSVANRHPVSSLVVAHFPAPPGHKNVTRVFGSNIVLMNCGGQWFSCAFQHIGPSPDVHTDTDVLPAGCNAPNEANNNQLAQYGVYSQ